MISVNTSRISYEAGRNCVFVPYTQDSHNISHIELSDEEKNCERKMKFLKRIKIQGLTI